MRGTWLTVGAILVLCSLSALNASASESNNPNPAKATIVVNRPAVGQAFEPGKPLVVSVNLYRTIRQPYVNVKLYESASDDYKTDGRLITSQHIQGNADGSFTGSFKVPEFPVKADEHYTLVFQQASKLVGNPTPFAIPLVPVEHVAAMLNLRNRWDVFDKAHSEVSTKYGAFSLSNFGFVTKPVTLYLNSRGQSTALYTLRAQDFGKVQPGTKEWLKGIGYQLEGRYLLVQWGMAPSSHPDIGDEISYWNTVVNLETRRVVYTYPHPIQSNDYLTGHSLVMRFPLPPMELSQQMNVVNLESHREFSVKFPPDLSRLGVFQDNRLEYQVVPSRGEKPETLMLHVPPSWWQPVGKQSVLPLPR